jgi:esterase
MATLTFSTVTAGDSARWVLFLHGILGSGANWRTVAKRLLEQRPGWGAALVDLRNHGGSQGFPEPHTLTAVEQDLDGVAASLPGPVDAIAGHSYGGKVAMQYVARRNGDLAEAWILDSTPASRPDARGSEDVLNVVRALKRLPKTFASKDQFHELLEEQGLSLGLRQWLAMNLRTEDGGAYRFRLDLNRIEDMLEDYWQRDLWPLFEAPPGRVRLHVVIGGRSAVWSPKDRERIAACAARNPDRIFVHVLENAGHWLQVDDPEGLQRLLQAEFSPA